MVDQILVRVVNIGGRDFTVTNQRTERMKFRSQQYYNEFVTAPEQDRFQAYYYWRYVSSVSEKIIYSPAEFGDLPEGATDAWMKACEEIFPEWLATENPTSGESAQTPPEADKN